MRLMAKAEVAADEALEPLPSWLYQPPTNSTRPPIETRPQNLPLNELRWDDFERLCLTLVQLDSDVEYCQRYGTPGQAQGGIDLYARLKGTGEFGVYQCKKVKRFGPAAVKKAVSRFKKGPWAGKANYFILCISIDGAEKEFADEYESQVRLLKATGVDFPIWDANEISTKLKLHPKIVDDFFGREWVRVFNGEDSAQALGTRLDAHDVIRYREDMRRFYEIVFDQHDPGIPVSPEAGIAVDHLAERYVIPEVVGRDTKSEFQPAYAPEDLEFSPVETWQHMMPDSGLFRDDRLSSAPRRRVSVADQYRTRESIDTWMARSDRSVFVGVPGSGKSSLLRYVTLDLLSDGPTLSNIARRWGDRVPVWLPFAFWTKLIDSGNTEGSSILGCVKLWLSQWNQEVLSPLVERAIEDERLLLLVDGLDEAVNEQAGSIALQELQVYVQTKNVAVLVTSRPQGVQRLPITGEGWQIGDLAPLSMEQQAELCFKWFTIFVGRNGVPADSNVNSETWVSSETSRFLEELGEVPELSGLAEVPLLLSLLLYLRLQGGILPRGRFEAYDHLVDHLIEKHPARRRTAGFLTADQGALTLKEVRSVLDRVAYVAHLDLPEGVIDTSELETIVVEALTATDSTGLGFSQIDARRIAASFLNIVEGSLGILVALGPQQATFFHRSIQEFLAARHLSRMDISHQDSIVDQYGSDVRWREVILGLIWNTTRSEDVDYLVDRVAPGVTNRLGYEWAEIQAEVAFGSLNCTIGLARKIASDTFDRIEHEAWMPHRVRLLSLVMLGLQDPRMRESVEQRIKFWLKSRGIWIASHYTALSRWPENDITHKILFGALNDEDEHVQLEAARSLAKVAESDSDVGDNLVLVAKKSLIPKTRAAALEALRIGWLSHQELDSIVESGRHSQSSELRLVSCAVRVDKWNQDELDFKRIMALANRDSDIRFGAWADLITTTLTKGWSGNDELKTICLESLKDSFNYESIDRDMATELLINAFPQDTEVGQYLAGRIISEKYPFMGIRQWNQWKSLAINFKNNPDLVAAIDEWAPAEEFHDPEVSFAALLGKTPRMKEMLISRLSEESTSIPHWAANALLEGWGIMDKEVNQALTKLVYGSPRQASSIAFLIPKIIPVKDESRRRLMELLESPGNLRRDMIIQGLASISESKNDDDVVGIVLQQMKPKEETFVLDDVRGTLIIGFPKNPLVRELAVEQLMGRLPLVDTVAHAYFDDADMRDRVSEFLTPLPIPLRRLIIEELSDMNDGSEFAQTILEEYDAEPDADSKVLGSIAYHRALNYDETVLVPIVEQLRARTQIQGFDYHERRLAALAGLLVLGRLDVIKQIPPNSFSLSWPSSNGSILRLVCHDWKELWEEFGPSLPNIFVEGGNETIFWIGLCKVALEFPDTHDSILEALELEVGQDTGGVADNACLSFVAAVRPSSSLLLELCLKALQRGSNDNVSQRRAVAAAEILSSQFGDRPEIIDNLPGRDNPNLWSDGLIAALCLGWPEDSTIDVLHEQLKRPGRPGVSPVSYVALIYSRVASAEIVQQLETDLSEDRNSVRHGLSMAPMMVVGRVRRDSACREALENSLQSNISPDCKINIPRILAMANGVSPALADWCHEEIERQLSDNMTPEFGFDIFTGTVRAVVHGLLDVVGGRT